MNPQNEREHENTPASDLVEQLVSLAVESCFHPSDGATKRLIDIKVEIIRRLSYAAAGGAYSVPAPFIIEGNPDKGFGGAINAQAPSSAEVKANVFPEEPASTLHNGPSESAGASSEPKQAKRKAKP